MVLVSADYGYVILVRTHVVEDEGGVDHVKDRNSVDGLCIVASDGDVRIVCGVGGNCSDLNGVHSGNREVKVLGGRAYVLLKNYLSAGIGDLDGVSGSSVHGGPGDSVCVYAYQRSGKLLTLGLCPYGKESGVGGKHSVLGPDGCQLVGLLRGTDPPAAEGITVLRGGGNVVELSSDGGHIIDVSSVKAYGVLELSRCLLYPLGVEGGVGSNGGRAENVRSGQCLVGIPSNESIVCLGGICNGRQCSAVDDLYTCGSTLAAVGVKGDCVFGLLNESDLLVTVGEGQHVACKSCCCRAVALLGEGEGDGLAGDGVGTYPCHSVVEGELITAVQVNGIFTALCVKVIDAGLRTLGYCGVSGLVVVGIDGLFAASAATDKSKCEHQQKCYRKHCRIPEPHCGFFHIRYLLIVLYTQILNMNFLTTQNSY